MIRLANPQVNCKICLKLDGLHDFFLLLLVDLVLCCYKASHHLKCLNFDGLSRQETIGHSYEAFSLIRLPVWPKYLCSFLLSK